MLSIRESFGGELRESVSSKWTVLSGRDFAVERLTREIAERSLNGRDISTQGPCHGAGITVTSIYALWLPLCMHSDTRSCHVAQVHEDFSLSASADTAAHDLFIQGRMS